MKKIKRRAYSLLGLIGISLVCLLVFLFRLAADGEAWVTFPSNRNVYTEGQLAVGAVYDRNDLILAEPQNRVMQFNESAAIRRANMHIVGDRQGRVGTGILRAYAGELVDYSLLTGTYTFGGGGNSIHLTIDAELSQIAYAALAGRHGAVVVMNYETGDILVAISAPTYDPDNPPEIRLDDPAFDGVFLNRVFSSSFTPGSIYKIVTAAAAMDTFTDAQTRTFTCTGVIVVDGNRVTCMGVHGTINLEQAMGYSCNPFFAQLALDLGGNLLHQYNSRFGLISPHTLGNIRTAAGSFTAGEAGSPALAWSGVGQSENLTNPLSMARFLGAVARGGTPVEPRLVTSISGGILPRRSGPVLGDPILPSSVANDLALILRNTAIHYYGNSFPGIAVAGKTGTAEVGEGRRPHSWFAGFLDDPNNPLAFVVLVENGGFGLAAAGGVANTVLQAAVTR